MNISSDKRGIKLLLTLKKAQKIYDDYRNPHENEADYIETFINNENLLYELIKDTDMTKDETMLQSKKVDDMNEKSTQMLKEVDAILKDIIETRRKVQLDKETAKIKNQNDYLKFMNVDIKESDTDINKESKSINNDMCSLDNIEQNYKKYLIDKDNCKSKVYDEIKMKLNAQKNKVEETKDMLNINEHKYKYESYNEDNDYNNIDEQYDNTNTNGMDDELEKLFAESSNANTRMDNLLDEIDECIILNHNINDAILENEINKEE